MSCVIGCGQDFGTAKEFDSRTDKLSCVKRITLTDVLRPYGTRVNVGRAIRRLSQQLEVGW